MDKIFTALGLNVCDFAFKTECCGAGSGYTKKDIMKELTFKVLDMARDAGANCVAVACPVCQMNLDLNQKQINKTFGSDFNMPVLYFTQIMGLAFGLSPKELGIKKLFVSPDKLLKKRMSKSEYDKMLENDALVKKVKANPKANESE
jgi:heterodisulfide reductase subunit B